MLVIGVILAVALLFSGCTSSGSGNNPAVAGTSSPTMAPMGTSSTTMAQMAGSSGAAPTVMIMSPQDKAMITGSNVTMMIQINNFAITKESMDMNKMQPMQNMANSGHIHWFIDVPAPTDPSKKAETAKGTWEMHDDTMYTFANVQPGTHTLSVELVNNDMTPITPPVYQTITVTVM